MEWSSSRLQDVISDLHERRGDSTEIEVKSGAGGVPSLGPTLCAFANLPEGGTIILGLDEASGFSPVGLTDLARYEQGVATQARDGVFPPVLCEFHTFEVAGSKVLVTEVAGLPLEQRPARFGGRPYLRQADGDYVMSEQELAQLDLLKTQARRPTQPDRQPIPGSSVEDLDQSLLAAYLTETKAASRRYSTASDEQVLRYTNVVTSTGELTLAGSYALGTVPQSHSPNLGITAAVQLPHLPNEPRTQDLVHLIGPIPDLLDEAMNWVVRNTRTTVRYNERGHAVDQTELPMRAVREIIANALVHRNLDPITDSKRVEIRLLHDRLVISSPGGLWGVSQSQLGHPGAKSAVNPVLYDICKNVRIGDRSRVIEGEGGGIREAIQALHEAGLHAPQFIDKGLQFSVIIYRHTLLKDEDLAWLSEIADQLDLTSEERSILVSMRHGEVWTNAKVRHQFAPIDSVRARRILQRLVDTKLVEAHGERGNTVYAIVPHMKAAPLYPEVRGIPSAQPQLPSDPAAEAESIKHAQTLLPRLENPATIQELTEQTGLSVGQLRYALGRLEDTGLVEMRGGQGRRNTTYVRTTG